MDPFLKVTVPLGVPVPAMLAASVAVNVTILSSEWLCVAGCQLDGRAASVVEDHVTARGPIRHGNIGRTISVEISDCKSLRISSARIVVDRSRKGARTISGEKEQLVVLTVSNEHALITVAEQADSGKGTYRTSGWISSPLI